MGDKGLREILADGFGAGLAAAGWEQIGHVAMCKF